MSWIRQIAFLCCALFVGGEAALFSESPEAVAEIGYGLGPGSYHEVVFVSPSAEQLELEDGSIWYIDPSDRAALSDWYYYDGDIYPLPAVYITANTSWFARYPFCIVNSETNQRVAAHMQYGPFITEEALYTRWIIDIDYAKQLIRLNDGTEWTVSGRDSHRFGKWQLDDTIIIGVNEDWISGWYPNLLINVNLASPQKAHKSYVRACSTF